MRFVFHASRLLLLVLPACLLLATEATPQIIVNNASEVSDAITTQPLIGYRKASKEFFYAIRSKGTTEVGFPTRIFVESAVATPTVVNAVTSAGKDPKNATFDDWYNASKSVGLNKERPEGLINVKAGSGRIAAVDPKLVTNLTDTELFGVVKPVTYEKWDLSGTKTQYMIANRMAYQKFEQSYATLDKAKGQSAIAAQQRFASADATLAAYPFLKAAARFDAGAVTLGRPTVYTANEKKLVAPASITAKNDVYWIEFAISYRNIDVSKMDHLTFGVNAPAGIIALELVPLRFEKTTTTKRTVAAPEIKIQAGDNAVSIGKIYEQEVVYTSLKPTITAQGLQENDFAWTLSDDAMQIGAQRFIAVVAVPKGRRSLTVQLQAGAQTKAGWFAQGDIVSITPVVNEIPLR